MSDPILSQRVYDRTYLLRVLNNHKKHDQEELMLSRWILKIKSDNEQMAWMKEYINEKKRKWSSDMTSLPAEPATR